VKTNKPLLKGRPHGNANKPLPPLLVCRGPTIRDSLFVVAFHITVPLSFSTYFLVALHVALPLCLSPPFLVALVLFFHGFTYTNFKTYIHKKKKEKKRKKKEEQRDHKNLK
jgi:hypothetical protein